jgi:putative Mn2+ efflux pump MntP
MTKLLALILVGLSVGLDNFAISVAMGLAGLSKKHRIRNSLVFGGFETCMPIIGFFAGRSLSSSLGSQASLFGGGLLILTGIYAILQDFLNTETEPKTPNSLKKLMIMGLSISIDSLIVGFSLGATNEPIIETIATIGILSVCLALLGMEIGSRLKTNVEGYSELLSGLILILVGFLIGFKII